MIGPDVSEHNGTIKWADVRGARFAIARIGHGLNGGRADFKWSENWHGIGLRCPPTLEELQSHGIRRCGYWFCYPESADDGVTEAKKMCSILGNRVHDIDLIALDAEDDANNPRWSKLSRAERRKVCDGFMATVEDKLQRRGLFYSYVPFAESMFGADYKPRDWKTWVARYSTTEPSGSSVFVDRMLLWQYTDGQAGGTPRTVAGIGRCDVSKLMGASEASFMRYGCRRA